MNRHQKSDGFPEVLIGFLCQFLDASSIGFLANRPGITKRQENLLTYNFIYIIIYIIERGNYGKKN